jgi:SAM-dependent methyltransferase
MGQPDVYAQGHAESVLRSQTWRGVENSAGYLLAELEVGMSVLDVGCGPGTITIDLARRVAPGWVVGVDVEASVVERARSLAEQLEVDNVEFMVGDVYDLPASPPTAPQAGFDLVHAHQVLLHLADPAAALRQMLRVARPGGIVAARDTDYAAMAWWPPDPRLDRWLEIYRGVAHDAGTEPDAGRRLLAWAHAAGATDVTPSASHWLHATPVERAAWGGMWAERIVSSTIAERAVASGRASRDDLAGIADAWRTWTDHPDGWFLIPHGEILCRR